VRVLILNSDSPKNRGDRAILAGNIELIRQVYPDAHIWSLSQYQDRDQDWFGINFHPMSPYSVKPADFFALLSHARHADLILWGGGEILKDYTNKLGLFYWALKIWAVSLANPNIVGAFQGIGPTSANISKRVIAFTVSRCKAFLVRDAESKAKLESWGVKIPVVSSFDPAVFDAAVPMTTEIWDRFVADQDVESHFLHNFAGFGLRRWFHYSHSGWLPAKFRFWARTDASNSPELDTYLTNLAALADRVVEQHDVNLVFFPMHVGGGEDDPEFARQVVARMKHGERTVVIAGDNISPSDYLALIGHAKFFVASRLHSAILATVANVPALCLYYVDKGRLFFEQIGQQRFSRDIKVMQQPGIVDELAALVGQLVSESDKVKAEQLAALAKMREQIKQDFVAGITAAGLAPSDVEGDEHKAEAAAKAAKVAKSLKADQPRVDE
jgi:polysaccharide pyruvyl transferase WcaK-like protein